MEFEIYPFNIPKGRKGGKMNKKLDEMTLQEINKIISKKGTSIFKEYYKKISFLYQKNSEMVGIISVFYFGIMIGKNLARNKNQVKNKA